MATKVSLTTLTQLSSNENSAVAEINSNLSTLANAVDTLLSRDGTSPNSMTASLDMNSQRILNLPDAVSAQEPATKAQLDSIDASTSNVTYSAEWANKAEDSLVSIDAGGDGIDDYSSLHWSSKATSSATSAASSATSAASSATSAASSSASASASALAASSSAIASQVLPVGAIVWWSLPTIPSGWVKANGAALTKSSYPDLDAKYFADSYPYGASSATQGVGTLNLPNIAGRFIRAVDDSAGVDPDAASRTDRGDGTTGDNVGTNQSHTLQGHTHTGSTDSAGNHNHSYTDQRPINTDSVPSGADHDVFRGVNSSDTRSVDSGGDHTHTFTTDSTGGSETRPKNIYQYAIVLANPTLVSADSAGIYGLSYQFEVSTTDANPASGKYRFNNGTFSSATQIYISDNDRYNIDVSTFILTWDSSTTVDNRATLKITKTGNPSQYLLYKINGASIDATGYVKLNVAYIAGATSLSADDAVTFEWSRSGDAAVGLTWEGVWATATSYSINDAVSRNGSSFICKLVHTSDSTNEPEVGASWQTYWDLIAQAGAGLSSIVNDTTPQLGNDLDTNSFNVQFDTAHGLQDDSGNFLVQFTKVGSAVNYLNISNNNSANSPSITAAGTDTNINLVLNAKGSGTVKIGANDIIDAGDSASTAVSGIVELATSTEITTGTDTGRAITPDGLSGSNYGKAIVPVLVFDDSQDVVVGDGAGNIFWRVPSVLNGWNLVEVAACVQTAGTTGTTDVQIHNITQAVDMLTTKITIDSAETDSSTAATAAVIDATNDDVATADQIRIDVDTVSTTAPKGLLVELTFQLP